ncbi:MAG: hypothetical protein JNK72_07720 [Myxococcales bacterium]|nr:hypothetical protein [Myxococcales bacterium]
MNGDSAAQGNGRSPAKWVYTVIERDNQRSVWTRIGAGWINRDGSMTLKLDALPVNGTLQVRDPEPRANGGAP